MIFWEYKKILKENKKENILLEGLKKYLFLCGFKESILIEVRD